MEKNLHTIFIFSFNFNICFSDSYNNARIKLKNAENHTDISTDSDLRGKGKRRRKAIHRYGFDTDVEGDVEDDVENDVKNNSKKKTLKQTVHAEKINLSVPKPPKELMQFQYTTPQKKKDAIKSYFCSKQQLKQTDEQVASSVRYESVKKKEKL